MPIIANPISPAEINIGDDISFGYVNSGENIPSRVGSVIGFFGSNTDADSLVKVFDYSIAGGASYRSYRIEYIVNLCRIEHTTEIQSGRIAQYRQAIADFGKRMFQLLSS